MDKQVLIAHATKYGATAEIAEQIGGVLRQAGFRADVVAADRVDDLSRYDAVVLGSGAYMGRWRKPATTFLRANESVLAEKAVWLFSSGPTGKGDPVELTEGWRLPRKLRAIAERIAVRDVAVFHGSMIADKMSAFDKWIIKKVKAPIGDFRDWEAITAWAGDIATALKAAGAENNDGGRE
jgi:menaquinone-dependent protoporphyrinogen oxidase